MILLDTDTSTLYFHGQPKVMQHFQAAAEVPVVSIVTRIEVLQGRFASVLKAADAAQLLVAQERLRNAERELAKLGMVMFDDVAAATFDKLGVDRKLRKIGRNDILIACIALANQATLVTRNLRDFQAVPGLKIENWAD